MLNVPLQIVSLVLHASIDVSPLLLLASARFITLMHQFAHLRRQSLIHHRFVLQLLFQAAHLGLGLGGGARAVQTVDVLLTLEQLVLEHAVLLFEGVVVVQQLVLGV